MYHENIYFRTHGHTDTRPQINLKWVSLKDIY